MYSSADSLFDSLWLDLSVTALKTDDLRLHRSFSVSSGIGSLGSSVLASGSSSTTTRTNSRTSSRSTSPLTPSVPVKPLVSSTPIPPLWLAPRGKYARSTLVSYPLTPSRPGRERVTIHTDTRVVYKGRDILDLSGNLFRSPWDLRPAVLPARCINMFWKNRSQYHRLSEYGTRETFEEAACPVSSCSFRIPIPGRD
uniref:Uncharacterized protein n=1 Tax=Timema poppense TaxID=170557 RepID=A0A7R9HEG6_TIMPO|nr:unnamed protein product [Timema poppensis]